MLLALVAEADDAARRDGFRFLLLSKETSDPSRSRSWYSRWLPEPLESRKLKVLLIDPVVEGGGGESRVNWGGRWTCLTAE